MKYFGHIFYILLLFLLVGCGDRGYDEFRRIGEYKVTKDVAHTGRQTGNALTDKLEELLREQYGREFVAMYEAYYDGYSLMVKFSAYPVDEPDGVFDFGVNETREKELEIVDSNYEEVMEKTAYGRSINQRIIFIYHYTNFAEEEENEGFYIDSEGRRVNFDFSNTPQAREYMTIDALYPKLLQMDSSKGSKLTTVGLIGDCYRALQKVDVNAEMENIGEAWDAGTECLYGVLDDGADSPQFILLSEAGNVERYSEDANAQYIMEILEKLKIWRGI